MWKSTRIVFCILAGVTAEAQEGRALSELETPDLTSVADAKPGPHASPAELNKMPAVGVAPEEDGDPRRLFGLRRRYYSGGVTARRRYYGGGGRRRYYYSGGVTARRRYYGGGGRRRYYYSPNRRRAVIIHTYSPRRRTVIIHTYYNQRRRYGGGGFCAKDSGGTCSWFSCYSSRGPVNCINGICRCKRGYCAHRGTCVDNYDYDVDLVEANETMDNEDLVSNDENEELLGDAEESWTVHVLMAFVMGFIVVGSVTLWKKRRGVVSGSEDAYVNIADAPAQA